MKRQSVVDRTKLLFRAAWSIVIMLVLIGCSDSQSRIEDIDKLVAEMSQRVAATTTLEKRDDLVPRFNQPKTVACLSGEFKVSNNLPDNLKHGLFVREGTYPVMARFANATKWDDSEKDIRGVSLRLSEIQGEPLWRETGFQDFLFNSYPALFVATPEEFLAFMRARQAKLDGEKFSVLKFFLSPFDPHVKSLITVLKARKKHDSPLDIRYWSTVPSALDNDLGVDSLPTAQTQAVKYSLTPCSTYQTAQTVEPGENQLRSAINAHLDSAPACFEFGVQLQTDPETMPLEDASVVWDEAQSPFQTVATLSFEKQDFDNQTNLDSCEQSQFNPWQSLPAHRPLGRMNAVRKAVYATGAYQRANR